MVAGGWGWDRRARTHGPHVCMHLFTYLHERGERAVLLRDEHLLRLHEVGRVPLRVDPALHEPPPLSSDCLVKAWHFQGGVRPRSIVCIHIPSPMSYLPPAATARDEEERADAAAALLLAAFAREGDVAGRLHVRRHDGEDPVVGARLDLLCRYGLIAYVGEYRDVKCNRAATHTHTPKTTQRMHAPTAPAGSCSRRTARPRAATAASGAAAGWRSGAGRRRRTGGASSLWAWACRW